MRWAARLGFPYTAAPVPAGVEPPPVKPTQGSDYDTRWARRLPARVTRAVLLESVLRPTAEALASPTRRGLDRLADVARRETPVIFAANHHSHIDTPLMLSSIPQPWRHKMFVGAAADYFFRTRVTSAASALALNAIPIERTKVTRKSADQAAVLIERGWSLLIFPEGGRSPDGWGQAFRGGAAYLSLRCDVPVVPVHIEGARRVLRKGATRPTPSATTVTFGTPMVAAEGEDSRRFAARIERAVAALADEITTDWYGARLRAHRGASPPLTGPQAPAWRRAWAVGDRRPRTRRSRPKRRWPRLE